MEPAELLQIRMPSGQLCGCEAHGGAGQLVFLMNVKRHVPYISADRVVWLSLFLLAHPEHRKTGLGPACKDQLRSSVI